VLCMTMATALTGATSPAPYQVAFGFSAVLALACLVSVFLRVK